MRFLQVLALLFICIPLAKSFAGESSLFLEVCAKCHGPKAEGNVELKAPSIAGQPDWYTLSQLRKFQADMRGIDPDDEDGALMHAVALTLNDDSMAEVAAHINNLEAVPTKDTLKGNARNGRLLYEENCMECHRYNAKGEMVFKSPSLVAYQDWYILSQLRKFRSGIRGTHPRDEEGAKMHRIAGFLEGEDDFKDIVAYISVLAGRNNK